LLGATPDELMRATKGMAGPINLILLLLIVWA